MLSVEDARARILDGVPPVATEIVSVADAWGRVLAEPVLARVTQPPADVSAMDGYAVRGIEQSLRIVGEAPAGHPWSGIVREGEAVRLFTGSVMPDGADAVVVQEDSVRDGDVVTLTVAPVASRHIRRAGSDFRRKDVLVPAGTRLGARAIGLIAAANVPWLRVHRRPRVAILSTGDEISWPGDPISAGGIVGSNAWALAALVRGAGAEPTVLPIAPDDADALAASLPSAEGFDLLLTSGGASVGDHDLVRAALLAAGMTLDFWRIAMRPGKPLMAGRFGRMPVLGLPGNPVSTVVTAILFAKPLIARLAGLADAPPAWEPARLAAPLPANDARADHLRCRLSRDPDGMLVATAFEHQASGLHRVLAEADALLLRAPHAAPAASGDTVLILALDRDGL